MNQWSKMSKRAFVVIAMMASFLTPIVLASAPAGAVVACDATWTGATSTAWTTASNWSPAAVPTSGQNVCVPGGLANEPTISSTVTVNSITTSAGGSLTVNAMGAQLTLAAASNIENLTVAFLSTVTTNSTLTVGALALTGGATINGSGSLTTTGNSAITNSANSIAVNWTISSGDDQNPSQVNWSGASSTLSNSSHTTTITSSGELNSTVTGSSTFTTAGLIVTDGNADFTGASINGPVTLNNALFNFNKTITGNLTVTNGSGVGFGSDGTPVTATVTGNASLTDSNIDFTANGTGTAGTAYDTLHVNGSFTLSGTTDLGLDNGPSYVEALGNTFSLIHAGSVSGSFEFANAPNPADPNHGIQAGYTSTDVTATVVPLQGQIEGHVYEDDNGNGTLTSDEHTGIDNITVYDDVNNNGTHDAGEPTDVTVAGGDFQLVQTPVGTAHLRATGLPAGTILTTTLPQNVTVPAATAGNGADVTTGADIGAFVTGSISGTVFNDTDGDGSPSIGESPISGVTVYLDANNNDVFDSSETHVTTASDGTYSFTGLTTAANPIRVRAVAPSGLVSSSYGDFDDITLVSSDEYPDTDFGFNTTGPAAPTGPQSGGPANDPVSQGTGYWLVGANGQIYSFGSATNLGSPSSLKLNAPIVGLTPNPQGGGYWAVGSDGGVFAYGSSEFYGSTGGMKLNQPITGITSTPDGNGYWEVAKDGGVFAYGDAKFYGSTGSIKLNQPIVGIATTPDGAGYWLVAKDGGVFAYGDAAFYGSMGAKHLNSPIVGVAASPDGLGYTLVAADGGIFAFGDAQYFGSAANVKLAAPIVSIKAVGDGGGYWLTAADGGVFAYGDAGFLGAPTTKITGSIAQ